MDLRALVLLSFFSTAVAQQDVVLTMTSGDQCFGSRVTLLCTHPDPSNHPGMYVSDSFRWAEDGTAIDFSAPSSARFTPTRLSSTASTLSFTVTEEDHRDRVFTCTCFLVRNNANRDREESNVVTMDALEQPLSPVITTVTTSSSSMVSWTHDTTCFTHHTFTYNVSWTRTPRDPSSSGHNTTNETEYMLSGLPPGEYSVSVQAVCNEDSSIISGVGSMPISIPTPTDPNVGGPDNTLIIIIVVVIIVVVVIVVIIIAVIMICVCRNKPKVTQTDVEEKPGQKVKTPPPDPLPPKKELRTEVVAILQRRKIVHGSLDHDEAVVGTYRNKTFVANFVYFEDDRWDMPEREIDEMVKMRDHQGTDKGLLVTNMEILPSNLLEKLEKQHCHFIGVGRIEQLNENALMKKFSLFFTSEK